MLEKFLTARFCYKVHFSGCELIWGCRKESVEQGVVMGKGLQKCGKTTFGIGTAGVESALGLFLLTSPCSCSQEAEHADAQEGKKSRFLVAVFGSLFQLLLACRQV